ncbi:MAG: hypothetical protein ACRDJ9_26960 [Dehalococcoidia bacterium]
MLVGHVDKLGRMGRAERQSCPIKQTVRLKPTAVDSGRRPVGSE